MPDPEDTNDAEVDEVDEVDDTEGNISLKSQPPREGGDDTQGNRNVLN